MLFGWREEDSVKKHVGGVIVDFSTFVLAFFFLLILSPLLLINSFI